MKTSMQMGFSALGPCKASRRALLVDQNGGQEPTLLLRQIEQTTQAASTLPWGILPY